MSRDDIINKLKKLAPLITEVTATSDMGYEFSAVVPEGIIYPEPGMLLNYSGGQWPPDQWTDKTNEECEVLLRDFILDVEWTVTAWEDLSEEELWKWLEVASNA